MHLFFYQGVLSRMFGFRPAPKNRARTKRDRAYQYSSPTRENKSPESFFDEK